MTEEEYFRKNYPDSCYGDKPLSPYWDFFQDGVEFGERQSEKKIEELEKRLVFARAEFSRQYKENAELKEKTEVVSCSSVCKEKQIELEKENAELEKENAKLNRICNRNAKCFADVHHEMCEGKTQLAQAKELLKKMLATPRTIYRKDEDGEPTPFFNPCYEELKNQAEQFLKEIEK